MKLPAWVLAVLMPVSLGFLAQVDAPPPPGWVSILIQGGSFAVLTYLIVWGLPRSLDAIHGERKAERTDFAASLRTVTGSARVEAEAIRAAAKAEMDAQRNLFLSEQRDTRNFYAKESDQMRQLYMDAVAAMRSAVHDVKDAAQAAVNRAQVAIEVTKASRQEGAT